MESFEKNGFKLYWQEEGIGKTIVFLPGWAEVPISWEKASENYLQDYKKIFLTLGGHYPAEFPKYKNHLSVDEFLFPHFEALDFIRSDEKLILIGHSTGGMVALNYYNKFPHRVEKLILVGGFLEGPLLGVAKLVGLSRFFKLSFLLDIGIYLSQNNYSTFLDSVFSVNPLKKEEFHLREDVKAVLPYFYEDYKRIDSKALRIVLEVLEDSRVNDMNLQEGLELYFIHGKQDPVVPYTQIEDFCRNYKGSKLFSLEGCGHSPHWEEKEKFWEFVREIIEG